MGRQRQTGSSQLWCSSPGNFKKNAGSRTKGYTQRLSRKRTVDDDGAPRLPPESQHGHPIAQNRRNQVRLNSDLSVPFTIVNCVKQGCVLALTLFSIFLSMMLKLATEYLDDDNAVYICYRLDGNLFNIRRLHPTQRLDLLFADNTSLVAHTERTL
ncbi:unnamed protein product [Acanthosepion pharaonis]|uniref:Uncharacterized protein n=1 Tax=Acanthosepion pharaonis TaxID=158019 RepID=A0A812AKJ9_ACAPH|nr:unnamed protein product [Sepia pharaonis]